MTTQTKGKIGRQDLALWDGKSTNTFTRRTNSGYTLTLNDIGWEIDVLAVYGDGTEYDNATLTKALAKVGSSNDRCFVLTPGTWTITSDLTITSNITLKCPPGVNLAVSSGITLTIQGPIEAGPYQIFSGSGTVTISGVQIIHDQWADGSGNDYYPSTNNSIELGASSYRWKNIYSTLLNVSGKSTLDDIDLGGALDSTDSDGYLRDIYMVMRDAQNEIVHQFPAVLLAGTSDTMMFI